MNITYKDMNRLICTLLPIGIVTTYLHARNYCTTRHKIDILVGKPIILRRYLPYDSDYLLFFAIEKKNYQAIKELSYKRNTEEVLVASYDHDLIEECLSREIVTADKICVAAAKYADVETFRRFFRVDDYHLIRYNIRNDLLFEDILTEMYREKRKEQISKQCPTLRE